MLLAACTTNAYVGKRQASNKPLVDPNGHTDNTGSVAYSIDLSDRRAYGVAYYPISREVDRRRLYTRGSTDGHFMALPVDAACRGAKSLAHSRPYRCVHRLRARR